MANGLKQLDVEKTEIKTGYCITGDQREEQIRVAVDRISGRLEPAQILSEEEVAIVCYGPSLQKTWQDVAKFKKIMTCSGAHQFLLEKGIVPTWHVDLDPREHKVRMLGTPHKDVEYLMASCCHPAVWDVLEGHNVKLWHIYNNENNKDVALMYPRGDWILTGGNNVGLRCMVVARVMGYRNFHIFGMDCSFPKGKGHHAGAHLNPNKAVFETPYGGKMYYCEPAMLTYARQFFHEVNQIPDITIKMHGEGLLQHMVHNKYKNIEVKESATLAFATPQTITPERVDTLRKEHRNPVYGVGGKKFKDVVSKLSESMKTQNIMDYGCGKGTLAQRLPFPIWEYDPAIPGKDGVPRPADLVICTNVLEHVEPEMLDNVLGDLVRCSKICVFAVINTAEGLIQKSKDEWHAKLHEYFDVGTLLQHGNELHSVLAPRKMGPKAA